MSLRVCDRCGGHGYLCASCARGGRVRGVGTTPGGKGRACLLCGSRSRIQCKEGHFDLFYECDICGAVGKSMPHARSELRGFAHACSACLAAWSRHRAVAFDAMLTERQGLRGAAEFVAEPSPVVELSTGGYSTWLGRSAMDSRRLHAVFIARMTPFGPVGFVEWRNPAELSAHEFVRWATFGGDG